MQSALIAARRVRLFFTIALILYAVAFLLQSLLPGYLGFSTSQAFSFSANDGWCTSSVQGFGIHCFGDFYYSLRFANLDAPWSTDLFAYPPLSLLFFKPFAYWVAYDQLSRLPLIVYMLLSLIALLIPAIHTYKSGRLKNFQVAAVAALSLMAAPALMAVDRGNNQLILVPMIYFFCLGVLEKRTRSVLIWGILLVLFKPQMIVLGAIFLAAREWKKFFQWSFSAAALFLLSFLLYPKGVLSNLKDYMHQIDAYQNSAIPGAVSPTNLSIANMWSWWYDHAISSTGPIPTPSPFFPSYITVVIGLLVALGLLFLGRFRSNIINLLIILSLPILLPNTSFAYYLCLLLPVFLIILADTLARGEPGKRFLRRESGIESAPLFSLFASRSNAILLAGTFYLLFIPWPLPWGFIPIFHDESWAAVGMNWMIGQFIFLGLFISLVFTGSIQAIDKRANR